MKLMRIAAGVGITLLAGCGGGVLSGPAPGVLPASGSQVQAPKAGGDLLYVSDTISGDVYVYTYPGGALKQTLTGFTDPGGECADANGNVFITNTGGEDVLEYAHGAASPTATLPDSGWFPIGCTVDPTTGNLAVTNFSPSGSSGVGDVAIYIHAKGKAKKHYSDAQIPGMLLCAYDGSGDLFVDGLTQASTTGFAELPHGKSKLVNISLDQNIGAAGGVGWDGKYVAVGDQSTNAIYRFAISGKTGKKAGTTMLNDASATFQFWIDGKRVVGPNSGSGTVGIWKYPKGGAPVKTITGLYAPLGTAVSKG